MSTGTGEAGGASVVVDVIEKGRGTGWIAATRGAPDALPLSATLTGGRWHVYAGDQDQYRGEAAHLLPAVKQAAKAAGHPTGTITIEYEYLQRPARDFPY